MSLYGVMEFFKYQNITCYSSQFYYLATVIKSSDVAVVLDLNRFLYCCMEFLSAVANIFMESTCLSN